MLVDQYWYNKQCPYRWVSGREEDDKRRWQINILVSKGDENTPSSPADLSVQHWV